MMTDVRLTDTERELINNHRHRYGEVRIMADIESIIASRVAAAKAKGAAEALEAAAENFYGVGPTTQYLLARAAEFRRQAGESE